MKSLDRKYERYCKVFLLKCAVYIIHYTVYIGHCTLYIIHNTMDIAQCIFYIILHYTQCTLYSEYGMC